MCVSCHSSCLTCSGTASTNCLTCESPNYFYLGTCRPVCPIVGFYGKNETRTCEPCDSSCLSCAAELNSNCTACNSTTFL